MKKIVVIATLILIFLTVFFMKPESTDDHLPDSGQRATATFAGGCFWCIESAFQESEGVVAAVSGYMGGKTENPTYEAVTSGTTGHYETVQITYDPERIMYQDLLKIFWNWIDPTDDEGQFVDKGSQYRTVVFYHGGEQKKLAEASKTALVESGEYDQPIVTQILPVETFYKAEDYHQDYYIKQSAAYKRYEEGSGRKEYVEENLKKERNEQ